MIQRIKDIGFLTTALVVTVALVSYVTYPSRAYAAISFVQSTTCNGTASPLNTTNFASSVTAGDLIVVTTVDDSGITTPGVSGITDTGGNTYTKIADSADTGSGTHKLWYAVATTGGSNFHITVTWNTSNTGRVTCVAQEFTGFAGTPTFDKVSTIATGNSTSALSGSSGTLSNANEVVVGSFAHFGTASAFSLGTGYTNLGTVNQANAASAQESKIVSATTAVTAGASIALAREWIAYVATFYDAGGGGGAVNTTPEEYTIFF